MSPTDGRDELRGRFTRWIVITAENAQKNYLRAEKKQLQTVPLEEADVAIVDTAVLRRIALILRNSVWLRHSGNFH